MTAFDLVGSRERAVALVEIPESADEKAIAERIMKQNKNVKSVLKRISERSGELRLEKYELIAGDKNTEVVHREHGFMIKLDPQKVYFSPREATERQRIAEQVKANETVLVMFSGVAPYALAIAKRQAAVERIYCIEKNADAHKYAEENVRMNKFSHKISLLCGDAKEEAKEFLGKCDRVLMPLPFGAGEFLETAFSCLKPTGGIVHFYSVGKLDNLYSEAESIIEKIAKKLNKKFKVLWERKVSQYAPGKWKICIDFQVV